MKKFLTIAIVGLLATALTSCSHNPQPVVYVQAQPAQQVAVQQQPGQFADPNQFYNDPEYANQPPVQQYINGQQVLVDAALLAYINYYHYNLGSYYNAYPTVSHFHTYRNGVYSGYSRGYNGYVTSTSYHYHAPNPKYVTRSGAPDMRYKANRPSAAPAASNLNKPNPRQYSLRPSTTPAQQPAASNLVKATPPPVQQARQVSLRPSAPTPSRPAARSMSLRKH